MREMFRKIKLSTNNLHLKNIFTDDCYLELGNIHYNTIERLLNHEIVSLDDIAFYPIQEKGLGHNKTKIENEAINKILPYLFFKNINDKERNKQLVITYGLIKYRSDNKDEVFMPLILLPINLYFENSRALVQLIAPPFENPMLHNIFTEISRGKFSNINTFETAAQLDSFLLMMKKNLNLEIKLENYLSFCAIKKDDIIIDHNRFNRFVVMEQMNTHLFVPKQRLYYSTLLSKEQRKVLTRSLNGQNIIISGRMGTGKTTALANVAINFIATGKKVLFISNSYDTLKRLDDFFTEHHFSQYTANFTKTFASLLENSYDELAVNNEPFDLAPLLDLYQEVDNYESAMGGRINNFYFHEIIQQLALLVDKEFETVDFDELSHLYRHEYDEIVECLEIIKKEIIKLQKSNISSFNESIWKEIPIINQVKYPNQITTLIFQINNWFKKLYEQKKELEEKYGFLPISNYAAVKKIMHSMSEFSYGNIPESWIDVSNKHFKEAEYEYIRLKNDIYRLQDQEALLHKEYSDLDSIDINKEIALLLNKYYTLDDKNIIDKINSNRGELTLKMNRADINRNSFYKKCKTLTRRLNWNFTSDDGQLKQMLDLVDFLNNCKLTDEILSLAQLSNISTIIDRLIKIKEQIDTLSTRNEQLLSTFPKLFSENDSGWREYLVKPTPQGKHHTYYRKHFNKVAHQILLDALDEKNKNDETIKKLTKEYANYTKLPYSEIDELTKNLTIATKYIKSIEKTPNHRRIISFLKTELITRKKERFNELQKDMSILKKCYHELNDFINSLQDYHLFDYKKSFMNRLEQSISISHYIEGLFISNQKMQKIVRNRHNDFISVDDYILIKERLMQYQQQIDMIRADKKYPRLFEKLFNGEKTDIKQIARVMQSYTVYQENFRSLQDVVSSFSKQSDILRIIDECKQISNEINDVFKLYCRIFKDGVSRFFYNPFEKNLEYLEILLHSKDELSIYLNITSQFYILNRYHLVKMIKSLSNTKNVEYFVENFKYAYFSKLYDIYTESNPIVKEIHRFSEVLKMTVEKEQDLLKANEMKYVIEMAKTVNSSLKLRGIANLDYQKYLERSALVKKIILSDTMMLDRFLTDSLDLFDLVIIDDAHLLDANEYTYAIQGKQVIISGEYQLHTSVTNNLISKMRPVNTIIFDRRFDPIPRKYGKHIDFLKSPIAPNYPDNFYIGVYEEQIEKKIYELFTQNKDVKINYFIENLGKIRRKYEQIASYFSSAGESYDTVIDFLINNINITDLTNGYLIDADYNIIDIWEYRNVTLENLIDNMLDNMLLVKKGLIVADDKKILKANEDLPFIEIIRKIIDDTNLFTYSPSDALVCKLTDNLISLGYHIFDTPNDLSFYIQKDNDIYGVLILWDNKNNCEILNLYRHYHFISNHQMKIIVINKYEMIKGIEHVSKKIIEEMQ